MNGDRHIVTIILDSYSLCIEHVHCHQQLYIMHIIGVCHIHITPDDRYNVFSHSHIVALYDLWQRIVW